jgi:hypothetical protein
MPLNSALKRQALKFNKQNMFDNSSSSNSDAKRGSKKTTRTAEGEHMQRNEIPPSVIQTSSAGGSSVSALEYSMPLNNIGRKVTFQVWVKDCLFPLVKFLPHRDNISNLDYSLDATTVCGFLRNHCGVSEEDAPTWWRDQRKHLRKTLTDFRNNRIKEIQKRFLGECRLCPCVFSTSVVAASREL